MLDSKLQPQSGIWSYLNQLRTDGLHGQRDGVKNIVDMELSEYVEGTRDIVATATRLDVKNERTIRFVGKIWHAANCFFRRRLFVANKREG